MTVLIRQAGPDDAAAVLGLELMKRLAALAVQMDCGRMEWNVLDWNEAAKGFYQSFGALHATGWQTSRLAGDGLKAFGA